MAFKIDDYLTIEEQAQVVESRRKAWAVDLYGHMLNKSALEAAGQQIPATTTDAITELSAALTATDSTKAELAAAIAAKAPVE